MQKASEFLSVSQALRILFLASIFCIVLSSASHNIHWDSIPFSLFSIFLFAIYAKASFSSWALCYCRLVGKSGAYKRTILWHWQICGMVGEGVHNKYTLDKYTIHTEKEKKLDADEMYLCALRIYRKEEYIEREKKRQQMKRKKIAKHTNHRDKSWSVNPVACKKCEKILKKSNEMRSRESTNGDVDEKWKNCGKRRIAYTMLKYICWYMISLAIRSGGGFVDDDNELNEGIYI